MTDLKDTDSCPFFLSCLRGSEPTPSKMCTSVDFLSCLRGSEPEKRHPSDCINFLSCLRGSEPFVKTAESTP